MVISPLFFKLCDFTPAIWKRRQTLPLLCEVPLTVLIFGQMDNFAHAFLPLFFMIIVFLPLY